GYDVVMHGEMEKITGQLRLAMDQFDKYQARGAETPEPPLSIRLAKLIKLFIALAFVSGAVVLIGTFVSTLIVNAGAAAGMVFSFAAVLQILLFNSDMHVFMHGQIAQISRAQGHNPFAGLDRSIVELMSGGFDLQPGVGLYTMTIAFFLAFFFAQTRVLSRASRLLEQRSHSRQNVAGSDPPNW
ncbi:MAG: hypothetical protein ABIS29_18490, partial [Vicinamibacterales bacterium]